MKSAHEQEKRELEENFEKLRLSLQVSILFICWLELLLVTLCESPGRTKFFQQFKSSSMKQTLKYLDTERFASIKIPPGFPFHQPYLSTISLISAVSLHTDGTQEHLPPKVRISGVRFLLFVCSPASNYF